MSLTLAQAQRRLRLVDRAVKRGQGKLPASSALPHSVPLGNAMVWIGERVGRMCLNGLASNVAATLKNTVEGEHELWFDQDGNAFLSFADKQDATMFRLALDGDLS